MAWNILNVVFGNLPLKPVKPPKPAVTARFRRHLHHLTKDHLEPTADLRADYARYLEIRRRREASTL
jgi:hypothetical protein